MKSIAQMIEQCSALIDTRDITAWENAFLKSVTERPAPLTTKQAEIVERIYEQHFA